MTNPNILHFYGRKHQPFLHGGGKNATDQLISLLNLKGVEKILELGFGTGATQVRLKSLFPGLDLYGLELSTTMIDQAKKRLRFVGLSTQNLSLLNPNKPLFPYDSMAFDFVVIESVLSILSINDIKTNLEEIKRVLKPDGLLVFNESIWVDTMTADEINSINKFCNSNFGINLAQENLHSLQAWQSFLSSLDFEIQSTLPVIPNFKSLPFKVKDWLSWTYSQIGKLIPTPFSLRRKYNNAVRELNSSITHRKQYIQAYIFICSLKSINRYP